MIGGNDSSIVAVNTVTSTINYAFSIRIERPIAGCEIAPFPYLTIKGGAMDNNTRAKMMEANPHDFVVRWRRSPRRPVCANVYCPRGSSMDPVHWTRFACGGPGLRCAVCERLRLSRLDSSFCSAVCFKQAWPQHSSALHTSINKEIPLRRTASSEDNNELDPSGGLLGSGGGTDDVAMSEDWLEICHDRSYTPTVEDIGCVLRIEVRAFSVNDGSLLAGPIYSFTEPVLAPPRAPPPRALVTVPGALNGVTVAARFRVVSYNILAEIYATKQAYPYCDAWNLSWPFRRKMIMDELEDCQGDIICLQELQSDHFEQSINPFLQQLGYDGLYKQKARESMGQYGKVDGCAIFWRRTKFALAESYSIDFNESARRAASTLNLDETECRRYINRLNKDNIAQVLFLEVLNATTMARNPGGRPPRALICVTNTHLYSNHMRPDVKLWQACTLINELENLVVPRDAPIIVCGDFNSEPDSAVYEFIEDGSIERHYPAIEDMDTLRVLPSLRSLTHSLELNSMMSSAMGGEPQFTNYTANFRGTLDYVWYTPGRIRVLSAATVPDEQSLAEVCGEGLPSANYPSDHVMLYFDVALMTGPSAGPITRLGAMPGRGSHITSLSQGLSGGQSGSHSSFGNRSGKPPLGRR